MRDEALRSVVVIGANALDDATGLLTRLGSALKKMPGKVLVVGYTDGSDPPTAHALGLASGDGMGARRRRRPASTTRR